MHISRRRIISFLILTLFTILLMLPLTGCSSGTTGDQASSPSSQATVSTTAVDSTREEEIEPAPKRLGIKPFWPYDTNAVGGGGKAMTNLASGNFLLQYTDVSFPGRGLPVEIRRTYNSMNGAKGYFGKGWSCIFDTHLVFNEITNETTNETTIDIILVDAYGGRFKFSNSQPDGNDTVYKAPPGRNTIFKKLADGTYSEKKKNGSTYLFDTAGKLVRLQHRNTNNYIQFIYDANGFPMGIHEASGRDTSIVCDELGRITSITDPQERNTSYFYWGNRLRKVVDPHNYRTLFEYDASGLLAAITTPRSFQSSIVYDGQNRIAEFHDPLYTVSYAYFDDRTEINDTYGHHLVYYLNNAGNTTHIVDTMGYHTYLTWDGNKNVKKVKNAKDQETTSTYDAMGNVLSVTNSLFTVSYTYDSSHNLTSSTDGNGKTTTFAYVPLDDEPDGVLDHVTTPLGRTAYFTYNRYGETISATNPRNFTTHYAYNVNGYVTRVTDANDKITSMTYNSVGEPRTVTDALGRKTTFAYDRNGRVTSVTTPIGAVTSYGYDQHGNKLSMTNPLNVTTSYTFDEDDRIATVTDGLMKTSTYTYQNGCLASTVDPMAFTTEMTYDENDRITGRANPITTEYFAYDSLGNLIRKSTRLGAIDYEYDNLNRLINVAMPGRTVQYILDNNGNRVDSHVYDSTAAWSISHMDFYYTYDDDNRMTNKVTKLEGLTCAQLSMAYDSNNNPTDIQVTLKRSGEPITPPITPPYTALSDLTFSYSYAYDPLDRQISVSNSQGHTYLAAYDDAGNMTGITYPHGSNMESATAAYVYDQENRISSVTHTYPPGGSAPLQLQYSYTYDDTGNCRSVEMNPNITGLVGPKNYEYDRLGRLTLDQSAMMRFEYDDAGNKTKDVLIPAENAGLAQNINYTYGNGHQLLRITTDNIDSPDYNAARWNYQYDGNGNMTRKMHYKADGTPDHNMLNNINTFNPMNRLISIKGYGRGDRDYSDFGGIGGYHTLVEVNVGGGLADVDGEMRQCFDDNDEPLVQVAKTGECRDPYFLYDDISCTTLKGYVGGNLLYQSDAQAHSVKDYDYIGDTWCCEKAMGAKFLTFTPQTVCDYYEAMFYTYLNGIRVGKSLLAETPSLSLFRSTHQNAASAPRSSNQKDSVLLYDGQNNPVGELSLQTVWLKKQNIFYTSYGERDSYGSTTCYGEFKGYTPTTSHTLATNHYQTGVRNYDPQTGRFLQPDPFKGYLSEPASQNPYMYCRGNPVKYSDPSGYEPGLEYRNPIPTDPEMREAFYQGLKATGEEAANLLLPFGATLRDDVTTLPFGLTMEIHHLLPQEFKDQYPKGINIQDKQFKVELEKGKHRLKSGNGIHTGSDNYNKNWKQFFAKFSETPTKEQVLEFLAKMRVKFKI